MQNGKKPVNFKQVGTTGLRRYGPYVYEEFMVHCSGRNTKMG